MNVTELERLVRDKDEETLQLEFKAAAALSNTPSAKREISKDVSALANSVGGTILYGIAESTDDPPRADRFDPVNARRVASEWLDQVIHSNIRPAIAGIQIESIRLNLAIAEEVVYCVTVPESNTAHMAADNRYYKRTNCRSVPMEDYEVRQTMFRATHPAYELTPSVRMEAGTTAIHFNFGAIVRNCSETPGHECSLRAYVERNPLAFGDPPEFRWTVLNGRRYCRLSGAAGVDIMPGTRQLDISDRVEITITDQILQLNIVFRLYDRYGLALEEEFDFAPNRGPQFTKVRSVNTGRKPAVNQP